MNNIEQSYWTSFYKDFSLVKPSSFAIFILNYFKEYKYLKLLDTGCGNGRDSYFLSTKFDVTGIDKSNKPKSKLNCNFVLDDMISYDKSNFDIIYSRFSFHSISDELQIKFLKSIKKNSYLCIETRSDKGKDTNRIFGDCHYRNLTNIDYLKKILNENNFKILYIDESDNFAIYKYENPICIRVICKL